MPKPKLNELKLARRAILLKLKISALQELYTELDEIALQLASRRSIPVGKRVVRVKDNFHGVNTIFRAHAAKRFEIVIE